jgi:cytosine permease
MPLIPLVILLILLGKTAGSIGNFDAGAFVKLHQSVDPQAVKALGAFGVLSAMLAYVVGFFATAGAAGVDFGTNSRDKNDVQMGGLVGIALAILVTAGIAILVVAGAYGNPEMSEELVAAATKVAGDGGSATQAMLRPASDTFMGVVMGGNAGLILFLLALAAFPPACFSSFIAANSFKTTLPNVNPFVSVGIGAAVSIILAVTGWAGDAITVFVIIGASFGPICGAMMVDYFLAGGNWPGPRAGFNPAGWISWALGFIVGILPIIKVANVPAAPVAAFIVGVVVYYVCAKLGLTSPVIPLPQQEEAVPAE